VNIEILNSWIYFLSTLARTGADCYSNGLSAAEQRIVTGLPDEDFILQ
jgi:hypothetical protein